MTLATYYHILNVSPRASDADIRRAYKMQAMRWHPDQNPHDRDAADRVFRQISRAYLHLKTQPQRDAYNRALLKLMQTRYEAANVLGKRRGWPPRGSKSRQQKYFRFGRARSNQNGAPVSRMKEAVNGR